AELLSPDQSEINSKVQLLRGRLVRAQRRRLQHQREQLQQLNRRIRDPRSRLREQAQRLDELEMRLRRQWQSSQRQRLARLAGLQQQMLLLSPDRQHATRLNALTQLQARLQRSVQEQMRRRAQQLQALQSQLRQLGPEQTLSRGYAIVLDQQGRAVRRAADLQQGQRLRGRFAEGQVALTVDDSE
ncbi:MAG: exodeoxyribonuclease VII large subunit, partial [Pseudomonadota bacterium]|nr:exodeoxyribonuclease VII large subunit [Pseudomonadota bacterium]